MAAIITFSDVVGERRDIGEMLSKGFSIEDLEDTAARFNSRGTVCKMLELMDDAHVLHIPGGASILLKNICGSGNTLFAEQLALGLLTGVESDSRVVFSDSMATIELSHTPQLRYLRDKLAAMINGPSALFDAEGNYWSNPSLCQIDYHQDDWRKAVINVCLGSSIPTLKFAVFQDDKIIGEETELPLSQGDIVIFSEKVVNSTSPVFVKHSLTPRKNQSIIKETCEPRSAFSRKKC
jgi:hypothetical protein